MDTDRNLLFGVLALQADLIDVSQFVEACTLWTTRKHVPLAQLLLERGWIAPADQAHVDYLLQRKLQKAGEDARASPAGAEVPAVTPTLAVSTVDHLSLPHERYTLTHLHATGGIGRVWLARDSQLGRDVALKELRPEQADSAIVEARFLREAQVTGQLEHPGVVPVYELARQPHTRQPFYTMRFVKGRTLSEAASAYHQKRRAGQAESFEFLTLLNAFVTVCNTIAYAHARGILHRDLKGQNVVLGDFGEVVVLDWGLAKFMDGSTPDTAPLTGDSGPSASDSEQLTVQGQMLGTPAYMAPEQAAGLSDELDRRTDVYGLGAILYEILAGRPPFLGADTREVLRKVREEEPQPPRQLNPDAPAALEAVCLRALAKQPADRYDSAGALAQEVQHWQEVQRRQAEEALQASEALYHSLVETLPLCVWRKDLEGRFTFGNKRFCDTVGKPLEEIRGKTDFDFYPPELAEKYQQDDAHVLATGSALETTEDHLDARGELLYVEVVKTPIFDAQGKMIGTQGIFWDLTAWKRAEAELRQSRERYELAVLGSQDGMWDWDLLTNQLYFSPRYKSLLGYEDDELPNCWDEWEKRLHPDDRERVTAARQAHLDGLTPHYESEHRLRHKDGNYRWFLTRGVALRDASGKPYRMAGALEDITTRKRLEEDLQKALEELARAKEPRRADSPA